MLDNLPKKLALICTVEKKRIKRKSFIALVGFSEEKKIPIILYTLYLVYYESLHIGVFPFSCLVLFFVCLFFVPIKNQRQRQKLQYLLSHVLLVMTGMLLLQF